MCMLQGYQGTSAAGTEARELEPHLSTKKASQSGVAAAVCCSPAALPPSTTTGGPRGVGTLASTAAGANPPAWAAGPSDPGSLCASCGSLVDTVASTAPGGGAFASKRTGAAGRGGSSCPGSGRVSTATPLISGMETGWRPARPPWGSPLASTWVAGGPSFVSLGLVPGSEVMEEVRLRSLALTPTGARGEERSASSAISAKASSAGGGCTDSGAVEKVAGAKAGLFAKNGGVGNAAPAGAMGRKGAPVAPPCASVETAAGGACSGPRLGVKADGPKGEGPNAGGAAANAGGLVEAFTPGPGTPHDHPDNESRLHCDSESRSCASKALLAEEPGTPPD